jgi:hypothetical protein
MLKQLGDPRLEGIAALVQAEGTGDRRILFRNAPPLDRAMQVLLEGAPPALVIPDLDVWRALSETCVPTAPELPEKNGATAGL